MQEIKQLAKEYSPRSVNPGFLRDIERAMGREEETVAKRRADDGGEADRGDVRRNHEPIGNCYWLQTENRMAEQSHHSTSCQGEDLALELISTLDLAAG